MEILQSEVQQGCTPIYLQIIKSLGDNTKVRALVGFTDASEIKAKNKIFNVIIQLILTPLNHRKPFVYTA